MEKWGGKRRKINEKFKGNLQKREREREREIGYLGDVVLDGEMSGGFAVEGKNDRFIARFLRDLKSSVLRVFVQSILFLFLFFKISFPFFFFFFFFSIRYIAGHPIQQPIHNYFLRY